MKLAYSVVAVLFCSSVAIAQGSLAPGFGVELRAEKAVHKTGGTSGVTFTLTNKTSQSITLSNPSPWVVFKGNTLVHSHISIQVLATLAPGASKSWTWDKKNSNGTYVGAGTYRIQVGTIWAGNASFKRSVLVALTPSGKLAGTSQFPVSVGNEWTYVSGPVQGNPAGQVQKMKVTGKWGNSGFHKFTNLIGAGDTWAKLLGTAQADLVLTPHPTSMAPLALYFRFNRLLGSVHFTGVGGMWKLTVGSVNDTVETPAGTFTKCYRLDAQYPTNAFLGFGYKSFWFAPGVGLVKFQTWGGTGGGQTYNLHKAKVKGTDNKSYQIGQN